MKKYIFHHHLTIYLLDIQSHPSNASMDQNMLQLITSIMLWWTLGLFAVRCPFLQRLLILFFEYAVPK